MYMGDYALATDVGGTFTDIVLPETCKIRGMVELRDYQQKLLSQVDADLADPSARIMMQLPTGGGKTHIAGELLGGWLQGGRKAVWLTHRRELASQTEDMLRESGVPATANIRWEPHTNAPTIANGVVILMAQTVSRRNARADVWQQYNVNDLIVIDEAHHATADGWARAIRQWPGPVLGMTATPWRLSEQEGFEHLFGRLVSGPQVTELQAENWLCQARVIVPPEEGQIRGGEIDATGDYSEAGIEKANDDRPDILTAAALGFWQKHARGRQTIIYAVSIRHAENLTAVFNRAEIPSGILLGQTPEDARARLLSHFRKGNLKVLINVAVATEGFDLPDAACVMLTRPTMSLSLYLQMVGRGLRPKQDHDDCLVLDLAGNSQRHGLPQQERKWSLAPRGQQDEAGSPLVVWCSDCEGLSPAASHICNHCGAPFGETCDRCGRWRAWESWSLKDVCEWQHDPVCDRCHYDAHIQEHLPVTEEMKELAEVWDDQYEMELSPNRNPFLKNFLTDELQLYTGAADESKEELRLFIEHRESELSDDDEINRLFEDYVASLPEGEHPQTFPQKSRLYGEWEGELRRELVGWQSEFAKLDSQVIDGQRVLNSAREKLVLLLEAEARESGLVPRLRHQHQTSTRAVELAPDIGHPESGEWLSFSDLRVWGQELMRQFKKGTSIKPSHLKTPAGKELPVRSWASLLTEICEWLIQEGLLNASKCPIAMATRGSRYLISTTPFHEDQKRFKNNKRLSNGLYLEAHMGSNTIAQRLEVLVKEFGQDPAQFLVWLQ